MEKVPSMSYRCLSLLLSLSCIFGCGASNDSTDEAIYVDFCPRPVESQAKPFDPPITETELHDVLQLCIADLLSGSDLQEEGYAEEGVINVRLDFDEVDWPITFQPKLIGYRFSRISGRNKHDDSTVSLAMQRCDVETPSHFPDEPNVSITLSYSKGDEYDWSEVGGTLGSYRIRRENGEFRVQH